MAKAFIMTESCETSLRNMVPETDGGHLSSALSINCNSQICNPTRCFNGPGNCAFVCRFTICDIGEYVEYNCVR